MAAAHKRGFTLIEIMVAVAIVGLLAAVAIPSFMRNAAKAKTGEAMTGVRRMFDGAKSYFMESNATRDGAAMVPAQFPASAALSPAVSCCLSSGNKCPPAPAVWLAATWVALKFDMSDPHYYRYAFDASGSAASAQFTTRALGDLDCDGDLSTFELTGTVSTSGEVKGAGAIFRKNDID